MLNLLILTRFDEHGAGPRYRIFQYLEHLKKRGIRTKIYPLFDKTYIQNLYFQNKRSKIYVLKKYLKRLFFLLRHKNKFDLVLMDAELFPFLPYRLEKFFLPKKYIIDQDDAIFHTYDLHSSWLVRALLKDKIDKIMRNSLHLIVGNSYVQNRALAAGVKQISVIPTVVSAEKYLPSQKKKLRNHIIIGWVGSPPTVKSLSLIEGVLRRIAQQAKIILHVIGAQYAVNGLKTICFDWQEGWSEEKEIMLTQEIDIGIMPLSNAPYEKGKCGFKLIKYMACAKPIIASPIGMNVDIVTHGENGFLAKTQEEWEQYLILLIQNQDLREKLGHCGREKMLKKYSLEVTAPKVSVIILQHLLRGHPTGSGLKT